MSKGDVVNFDVYVTPLYDGNISDSGFKPDIGQTKSIIGHLLSALEQLTTAGKCHNDLKPTNIIYKYNKKKYTIRVSDFGQCGRRGGTPGWTAPIFNDRRPGKEDMFSVGLIILQLLCADKNLFYCLRDNFVDDPNADWIQKFRNMIEINFVIQMVDLDNQPSVREIQTQWKKISAKIKMIDEQRLLTLGVPSEYLKTQYSHTT